MQGSPAASSEPQSDLNSVFDSAFRAGVFAPQPLYPLNHEERVQSRGGRGAGNTRLRASVSAPSLAAGWEHQAEMPTEGAFVRILERLRARQAAAQTNTNRNAALRTFIALETQRMANQDFPNPG